MVRRIVIGLLLCLLLPSKAYAQNFREKDLSTLVCPGDGCLTVSIVGAGSTGVQITGTFVGTLQFEQTVDNVNYVTWAVFANGVDTSVTSTTTTGLWVGNTNGIRSIRIRFSAYTSGTATVSTVTTSARSIKGIGGGSSYTNLFQDGANTLAEHNGTTAQLFHIYNSFTDASNYERLQLGAIAGPVYSIQTQGAGTGSARDLRIGVGVGGGYMLWTGSGTLLSDGPNTRSIGTAASPWAQMYANEFNLAGGNSGLWIDSSNRVAIRSALSGGEIIDFFNGGVNIGSAHQLCWGAGNPSSAVDTCIHRTSSGLMRLATADGTSGRVSFQFTDNPTCATNCGTSPTLAGVDSSFTLTMGATGSPASGFIVTFNGTWPAAPQCHAQMAKAGMIVGKMVLTVVTTTTTATFVTNGTAPATTDMYHVQCSLGQ